MWLIFRKHLEYFEYKSMNKMTNISDKKNEKKKKEIEKSMEEKVSKKKKSGRNRKG